MVRLVFTKSQPKKDAKFFISVLVGIQYGGMDGEGGSAAYLFGMDLDDASSMLTSSHVLFSFQFNCATTEGNYLQLFLAGQPFLPSEARGVRLWGGTTIVS